MRQRRESHAHKKDVFVEKEMAKSIIRQKGATQTEGTIVRFSPANNKNSAFFLLLKTRRMRNTRNNKQQMTFINKFSCANCAHAAEAIVRHHHRRWWNDDIFHVVFLCVFWWCMWCEYDVCTWRGRRRKKRDLWAECLYCKRRYVFIQFEIHSGFARAPLNASWFSMLLFFFPPCPSSTCVVSSFVPSLCICRKEPNFKTQQQCSSAYLFKRIEFLHIQFDSIIIWLFHQATNPRQKHTHSPRKTKRQFEREKPKNNLF